jgi:hypothetical protein
MKQLSYFTICEDIAHQTFMEEFLNVMTNADVSFSRKDECFWKFKFANKSDVLQNYAEVAARSLKQYAVDVVFVIADYDDWELADFNKWHDYLHDDLQADIKQSTFILLPVRAIEFWLWHLNYSKQNPDSTKREDIDNQKRSDLKKEIYGTKKPYKELSERKVKEAMHDFNLGWLSSRSDSFNHFYVRFDAFIKTIQT